MRKLLFVLLALLVVLPVGAQTTKNLTYDDPIYTFIDKCYTKGWIYYVPDVKPYTGRADPLPGTPGKVHRTGGSGAGALHETP